MTPAPDHEVLTSDSGRVHGRVESKENMASGRDDYFVRIDRFYTLDALIICWNLSDVPWYRQRSLSHCTRPLILLIRMGFPWEFVYKLLPSPPYCPFPHMSKSVLWGPFPANRSTIKPVRSPPVIQLWDSCNIVPSFYKLHTCPYINTFALYIVANKTP